MKRKTIRDAAVTGSPATLVMAALIELGMSTSEATIIAIAAGGVASAVYRAIRTRWPWLLAADAPSRMK
jgi:ABC-type uncharacterized transport system permease subunit